MTAGDIFEPVAAALRDLRTSGTWPGTLTPDVVNISVEYPGIVAIGCVDGSCWNVGTANGSWGADLERDGETLAAFETGLDATADAAAVAAAVAAGIRASYAAR